MKILFISTTYPTPTRPRQGAFNFNMVESLRVRNDVRVIAPVPWVERLGTKNRISHSGSDHTVAAWHPTYMYPPKILRSQYDVCYWQSILPTIRRLEKSFVPDLVLGYWLHPDGAVAQYAANRFGVPCVVFSGGSDLKRLPANAARKQEVAKVLSMTDRLIVVSHDLARCASRLGIDKDKIDVVYRGINHDCFYRTDRQQARISCEANQDAIVLLWSGRFESVKNPRMLLRVVSKLAQRWGDRLLVLVAGDGSMQGEMVKLRSALGLEKCVRFEGNLSQRDLAVRYNAANLMLLTSHSEGVPNVLLEAMSCDTPFVATNVGGVAEIATPGVDQLVSSDDVDAFSNAVIQSIESPSQKSRVFRPTGQAETALRLEEVFRQTLDSRAMRVAG